MRNEDVDIGALQAIALEQLQAELGLLANRELEHLLAILVNIVQLFLDGFLAAGVQTATARHIEKLPTRSIHFVDEINEPL